MEIAKYFLVLLHGSFYFNTVSTGGSLTQWHMEVLCDKKIFTQDLAGELHFNADFLGHDMTGSCVVTITPQQLQQQNNAILFYFKEFDIKTSCLDSNVSVLDGDSRNSGLVSGLPQYLCGNNASLMNASQTFVSTGESLTLVFNRNSHIPQSSGQFVLKYISFARGICLETSETYQCNSETCIPAKYKCSEERIACEQDDTCNISEDRKLSMWFDSFATMVKYMSVFILSIGILIFVKKCILHCCTNLDCGRQCNDGCQCETQGCRQCTRCIKSCFSVKLSSARQCCGKCFSSICQSSQFNHNTGFQHNTNDGQDESTSARINFGYMHSANTDSSPPSYEQVISSNGDENCPSLTSSISNENNSNTVHLSGQLNIVTAINDVHVSILEHDYSVASGSSMDNTNHFNMSSLPLKPPPTYDDVVVPSYEEVMANRHRYS